MHLMRGSTFLLVVMVLSIVATLSGHARAQDAPATSPATAPKHQTVIRVLAPDGQPLGGAVLYVDDSKPTGGMGPQSLNVRTPVPGMADERGEYRWEHGSTPDGFQVSVGIHNEKVLDAPVVTIRVTEYEMRYVSIGGALTGQLLLSDGKPARGWYVAQSGWTVSMMAGHTPSIGIGYGPGGLQPVDANGAFHLDVSNETLAVVSPEGVPLLYYVSPANWVRGLGPHRVILTLPKTRMVERGQVVDDAGKPVAGLKVTAGTFFTEGCNSFMFLSDGIGMLQMNPAPLDAVPNPAALTDAEGRFAIPVPWGMHIEPAFPTREFTLVRQSEGRYLRQRARDTAANPNLRTFAALPPIALRGHVLDPVGKPVPGVQVRLYTLDTTYRQWRWTGEPGRTDADGRFTLTSAPSGAFAQVESDTAPGGELPGWTEPVPLAGGQDLEIRLKPGGTLRVLLPQTLAHPIKGALLQAADLPAGEINKQIRLTFDAAGHCLTTRGARPGTYSLQLDTAPELADVLDQPITIKEGQETLIDLSRASLPADAVGPERWANLKVLAAGKPAGGIQVGLFTEQFAPELVAGWLRQWQTGDEATRTKALAKLQLASSATRNLAAALKPEEATALLGKIQDRFGGIEPSDDLLKVTTDLSDEAGLVRFKGQVGRSYIACAFAPGRWMAWQRFTLTPATDPVLELRPTRPLVVHLPAGATPPRATEVSAGRGDMYLRFVDPAGLERLALLRFLSGQYPPPGARDLDLRENGPDEQFDDVPIGTIIELASIQKRLATPRTLKIDPGDGPVEVTLQPAP